MSKPEPSSTRTEIHSEQGSPGTRVRPFLYLVAEGERPLVGGARFALQGLDEVLIGRSEDGPGRQVARETVAGTSRLTVRIGGEYHSKDHAVLRRNGDEWAVKDLGSRNPALVNGVPAKEQARLDAGDVISIGRMFFIFDFAETDEGVGDLDLEDISRAPAGFLTLLPSYAEKVTRLRREAPRTTSITLVGETGTGKEIIAEAIHAVSGRRGPYLAVNCGAIPRDLIQSELFGSVKGGYTGAQDRNGYLRDAHLGTLLLDEIKAAPDEVQVSLLRGIQDRAVTPLGGTRRLPVDVRFICATQESLAELVKAGRFREDLRQRIEAFRFELPPLRARREDIGIFTATKLRSMGLTEKDSVKLTAKALWKIFRYHWPGNIRELAQKIDVSWGGAKKGEIDGSDLPAPATKADTSGPNIRKEIIGHLQATRGNVAEAAQRMGRSRWFVYEQLRKLRLDPESFRSG